MALDNPGTFQAGDRVYVTARRTGVCDVSGVCASPCLAVNSIDTCFSEEVSLFRGKQGCLRAVSTTFGDVALEHAEDLQPGDVRLITGALRQDGSLCPAISQVSVQDNRTDLFVRGCGTLQLGFECAPLIALETPTGT